MIPNDDCHHIHEARASNQSTDHEEGASSSRSDGTGKDVISQVTASSSQARPEAKSTSPRTSDKPDQANPGEKANAAPPSRRLTCKPCETAHKKCLHRVGGARDELDPHKCMMFLRKNPTRPSNGKINVDYWRQIERAARTGVQAGDGLSASKHGKGHPEATATRIQPSRSVSTIRLGDNSTVGDPATNGLKRPSDRSEDMPQILPLAPSNSVWTVPDGRNTRPDAVVRRVLSRTTNEGPRPQPNPTPSVWTEADEQRALDALRARGVVIESDSEADGDASDPDEFTPRAPPPLIIDPLHHVTESLNPFDVDHSLDIRNPENYYRALNKTPPWKRQRPSKKQLMGGKNLLLYQTRENRHKYGDPHKQLIRKVGSEAPVTVIVEKGDFDFDLDTDTDIDTGGRGPDVKHVRMTFRESMGMPKWPIIVQGKSKEELVFVEQKSDGGDDCGHSEDETFPFVYHRLRVLWILIQT